MKFSFLSRWFAGLFALLFAGVSSAQDTTVNMTTLPGVTVTTAANVSKQVSKAFSSTFKDAQNPKWFKVSKNYVVEFIQSDMKNKAMYQKNGRLIYHISYGNEKNLPPEIKKSIRNNYEGYSITTAINVQEHETNAWMVNLEGNKNIVVLKATPDGAVEEVYNYSKSKTQ
jgi:hypothetical protein